MSQFTQFKTLGLISRGTYSASTTYTFGDVVTDGAKAYVCKVASSYNVTVTDTNNWSVLVGEGIINVSTTGTGTTPSSFTLTVSGNTVTLNKVS